MTMRLQDIYTFFVVTRAGSMQDAATEIGVTPGAVSQRIKAIEERSGNRLFSRSRKGIALTRAGEALWSDVSEAFSAIEAAHERHVAPAPAAQIRISAAPTFAYACLVPRLGEFTNAHPQVRITIETDHRMADLRTEPIDLAIRHGLGEYAGLTSQWLSSPELIVVGSPELLAGGKPIDSAVDCLAYPLLRDTETVCSDWHLWCKARGIDVEKARFGPAFKDDFLILKAAVQGQGLALIHDVYVHEELFRGDLIKACEAAWPTHFAYYAVALPDTFERPAVRTFVQWLKSVSQEPFRSGPAAVRHGNAQKPSGRLTPISS